MYDKARELLAQRGEPDPALALAKILWDTQSEAMRMHYQEGMAHEKVDVWYKAESRRVLALAGLL